VNLERLRRRKKHRVVVNPKLSGSETVNPKKALARCRNKMTAPSVARTALATPWSCSLSDGASAVMPERTPWRETAFSKRHAWARDPKKSAAFSKQAGVSWSGNGRPGTARTGGQTRIQQIPTARS
jgi:hypothetical protein